MVFVINVSKLFATWIVLNIAGLLQAQISSGCPKSWTRVGVRCYKVFKYNDPDNEDRTWHFANDRCEAYGGYLACINEETEDDEVNYIRKKAGIADESYYWIGLTDSLFEGKFLWVDGTVAAFTKWLHPLEPNSQNPTDQIARHEDYVVASGSKNWSDVRADWTAVIRDRPEPSGYVCEADLLMPPGPPGETGSSGPVGQQGQTGAKGDIGPPGPIGAQGARGEPGPKGDSGLSGATGATGPSGPQGKTGRSGPRGYTGFIGPPGIRGPSGPRGLPGDPGLRGLRGLQGPTGPAGLDGWPGGPGEKGERGEKGLQGDPGFPGPTGQAGKDGLIGLRGPDGQPGEKGETGAPGITGAMGPSGYPGLPGDKGQQGSQGLQGVPGEPGERGEKGDVGDRGAPGPTGKQGPEGLPGRNGYAGARGLVGLPGSRGLPGIAGVKGQRGDRGERGDKGETGDWGPLGLRGPIGSAGQRGEKGVVGDKGPIGDAGPRGPQGAAGPPGPPGPPGPMMDHGLPTFVHTDQPGEVSRYINASAFCSARGSGVYSHPLHCWQFVVCGQTFGGSFELTCYAGRRFDPQSRKCVVDNGCIFGSLSYNKTRSTKTSKLIGVDGKNGEEISRLERDVSIHTGVAGLLIIVVTVLAVVVCRLYVNRNRSLMSPPVQYFGDDVSIISNKEITDSL